MLKEERFLYRKYKRESQKLKRIHPEHFCFWDLLRFYFPWRNSLKSGSNPLIDRRPWITFAAINFLDQILAKSMRVLEYGTGGSTLYFATRVKEVISVEHDKPWAQKVELSIQNAGLDNCHVILVEPEKDPDYSMKDPKDPFGYISGSKRYTGNMFQAYSRIALEYPDNYFDLVLIDGRARPSCAMHAVSKIRDNGYLVWDDTERTYYHSTMRYLCEYFNLKDFLGPAPYVKYFSRTSIWRVPGTVSHRRWKCH